MSQQLTEVKIRKHKICGVVYDVFVTGMFFVALDEKESVDLCEKLQAARAARGKEIAEEAARRMAHDDLMRAEMEEGIY